MDRFLQALRGTPLENRIRSDEQIALHTLLKVGGQAAYYVELDKTSDLTSIIKTAHESNIPYIVIGSGSKTLFSDEGFSGLVIKNNTRKFDVLSRKGKIRNNTIAVDRAYIYADSGTILNQVVRFSIEQGYSGLEDLLGISGTVGGALFSEEIAAKFTNVLYQIQAVTFDGKILQVSDHDLYYSDSKGIMQKGNYVVLSVIFELFPGIPGILWEKGRQSAENRSKERPESPFSYPAFSDITVAQAMSIPTPGYTRSAGYLLKKAGLLGKKIGNAELSEKHPNFLVNLGNASGNDMIGLLEYCIKEVKKAFGVVLRPAFTIVT